MAVIKTDFKMEYEGLDNLYKGAKRNYDYWRTALTTYNKKIKKIIDSNDIKGEYADNLKDYYSTVHVEMIKSIKGLLELHYNNFLKYQQNGWYDVEASRTARIEACELEAIHKGIKKSKTRIDEISTEVGNILNSIADLYRAGFSPTNPKTSKVISAQDDILNHMKTILTYVEKMEGTYSVNNYQNTGEMIAKTNSLISDLLSQSRTFKMDFSGDSLASIPSWGDFVGRVEAVNQEVVLNQEEFKDISAQVEARSIDLAEYKKREQAAKYIKIGVAVLTTLITVAAMATPAGPVALGLLSGVTSSISTAANKLTDEWADKGNLKNVNVKNLVIDCAVSFTTGFVTGAIGPGMTKTLKSVSVVSKGLNSSHIAGRIVANAAVGSTKEIVKGGIKRIGDGVGNSVKNGRFDIDELTADAFNVNEIKKDAITGALSGSIDEIKDTVSWRYASRFTNSDNKGIRITSSAVIGGITETGEGFMEDYISERVDGKGIDEALKKAADPTERLSDMIKGTGKSGMDAYNQKDAIGKKLTAKDLKDPEVLKKIPTNRVHDPKEFVKNGGEIYVDNNGKYTFEVEKFKTNKSGSYTITKPDGSETRMPVGKDRIYYGDDGKVDYSRSSVSAHQRFAQAAKK